MDDDSVDNELPPVVDNIEHLPETVPPGATPRLLITKLVLENFKSYAGVKEIGPFQKCFSSIVGPNGSGKSNVIDAMLFVFGKRAKKLRLNKVSELIHKSDAVKDAQFARVSVYFEEIIDTGDGDDDYEVVPNTERVVTRIARRDNSSFYKLDGKNCAFKDVATYLGSKGIDLDNNRFLILQGEVEMISMMPPKGKTESDEGLLEYLEDIIGSSKYVEETNQAAVKVEALETQRQEKLNRVKAVEKEKDNLEGARQEAEALLAQEREIRRKKNILFQMHKMKADKTAEKLVVQKEAVVEKLSAARERLEKENERVEEIESGLSQQRKEYDKIHAELKQTKEEFLSYERRDVQLREEIKHAKAQLKKLDAKITSEGKNEVVANAKMEEAKENIPELEAKIDDLKAKKDVVDRKVEQILEDRKGETEAYRVELEVKTKELAPLKQERGVHQAALDTAQGAVDILEESVTRAKAKLEATEKELASLDSKQQTKRDEQVKCQQELDAAKRRIVDAEAEETELGVQEANLASRSKVLMARVEDAKANLQSAGGGRSPAVASILKAAKNGGELSKIGILGRLGDLATIPEKYDVAVTTACGMLDHIVVQTTAAAQKCVEFLRKNKLGRANFIPLEKLKKGAHDRAVETPEGAPRLFELISPGNPIITPAIYLAVGNTLVAPDLQTATRWAYEYSKRWRVVSLDGSLIEIAGTMSGGGKSVRKGGMRLANSRSAVAAGSSGDDLMMEDCEKLEAEAKRVLEALQDCRKRRHALTEEIQSLKKKVKALQVQLPKYTMDIADCDTTREQLTKGIPQLSAQCSLSKEDVSKLAELNKKVQECKKNLDVSSSKASKLESEIATLQKSILEAGGPELKKQQALCKKIVAETREAETKLNSERVSVTKLEKAAKKAADAKASAIKGLEKCKQTLEDKQAEMQVLDENAAEVMKAFEKVKVEEAEQREKLEAVSKECETLKQSQSEIKCVEIDLLVQIEGLEKQLSECSKKSKHWDGEIKKLLAAATEDDSEFSSADDDEPEEDPAEVPPVQDADGDVIMEGNGEALQEIVAQPRSRRSPLPTFSTESLEQYSVDDVSKELEVLEAERSSLAKNANMGAIAEYRKKEADYLARVADLDEVTKEQNAARKEHENLRRLRLEMFMDGFGKITLKLKEMYQMITLGGDAELELVDSLDPFSEGIVFSVRPPKKSWKNISNLSGGEKTLSSLALVFALHHFKPTPLYVMDEIDAALDFKNVSIVANYIKERTKDAQFIIISLRNNMFELADRLVGIYKINNCTKSVTINPRAFGVSGQQDGVLIRKNNAALIDRTNEAAESGRHVSFQAN